MGIVRKPSKPKWSVVQQVAAQWTEQLRTESHLKPTSDAGRVLCCTAGVVTIEDVNQTAFLCWAYRWLDMVSAMPSAHQTEVRMREAVELQTMKCPEFVLRWLETAPRARLNRSRKMYGKLLEAGNPATDLSEILVSAMREEGFAFLRLFHNHLVDAAKLAQIGMVDEDVMR